MKDPEINDKNYYLYIDDLDIYYFHKYFGNIKPINELTTSNSFYMKFIHDVDLNYNIQVHQDFLKQKIQTMSNLDKINLIIEIEEIFQIQEQVS